MSYELDRFKHKGLTIIIVQDEDCISPLSDRDGMPEVVRFQPMYENPSRKYQSAEDVQYAVKHEGAKAFGLWGGSWGSQGSSFEVRYGDPFKDEDLGREHFGFVVYPKELIPQVRTGSGRRDVLYKDAINIVEEYEKWCNGECYGYIIQDEDGEELDSCWGFIGDDYVKEEAIRMADFYAEEQEKEAASALYWAERDVMTEARA